MPRPQAGKHRRRQQQRTVKPLREWQCRHHSHFALAHRQHSKQGNRQRTATTEETMWRVFSTFLLGQHFQAQSAGGEAVDLEALAAMYAKRWQPQKKQINTTPYPEGRWPRHP